MGAIQRSTMDDGDEASPFITHSLPGSRALVSNNSYHMVTLPTCVNIPARPLAQEVYQHEMHTHKAGVHDTSFCITACHYSFIIPAGHCTQITNFIQLSPS